MDTVWVGFMVSRTLPYNDVKAISRELKIIFGDDLIGQKIACNDQMSASGEYFIFVHCRNYWNHIEAINKCHFITSVIPSRDSPYHFSTKEVNDFVSSAGHKESKESAFKNGDVVLVKDGYLKGLYGIVIKELSCKKLKVFFSFYVRQFSTDLSVTVLEFIGKVSGYEIPDRVGKPVIIGAHIVHHGKLHRGSS
jgi:hypothetical protein